MKQIETWQAIVGLVSTVIGGGYAWLRGVRRDRGDDKKSRGDALSQLDDQVEELFRERVTMRREVADLHDKVAGLDAAIATSRRREGELTARIDDLKSGVEAGRYPPWPTDA